MKPDHLNPSSQLGSTFVVNELQPPANHCICCTWMVWMECIFLVFLIIFWFLKSWFSFPWTICLTCSLTSLRRRQWHPTPVLLPGKSHRWRSLVGCSSWGCYESDTTERLLSFFTFMHWRRKWQPTPVFLPGESQGQGSLVGCRLWGCRVGHDWSDLAAAAAAINICKCSE